MTPKTIKLPTISPPDHLETVTKKWWRSVAESYELEDHHRRLLTLACESWDECQAARAAVAKHGLTYTDRYGQPKERPEVSTARQSRLNFAKLVRELGLDVADIEQPRLNRGAGYGRAR